MANPIQTDPRFEEMRKMWYREDDVLFNLIDAMKYREGTFIRLPTDTHSQVTIRNVKANMVRYLKMNMERFHFLSTPCNLYASVAKFPNMPMLSFNPKIRREEQDEFNDTFERLITEYDFLLDIDNPDLKIAYATAYRVKQLFGSAKIPYTLTFSGNKGFHVRVAFEDFPEDMQSLPKQELAMVLKRFAENFRTVNALYSIDLSIFDLRRLAKVAYSVVYPNYLIALPLSDEEIDNFTLEYCSMVHWLKPDNKRKLFKRGLLKREGDSQAFGKMVERYLNP